MPEYTDLGIVCDMTAEPKGPMKDKKSYPCLYVTSEDPIDFSELGSASIHYGLIESAEKNRDGKTEYRYELEVRKIAPIDEEMDGDGEGEDVIPVKRKPKGGLKQSFGDALDKARAIRYSEE